MISTKDLIKQCEERYNNELIYAVDDVIAKKSTFVMVTGASCAGKTTTTKKLREYFARRGVHAETVSLDDFYLDHDNAPLNSDGKPDFETIHSLDLPLLDSVMCDLAAGKHVRIPRFDFTKKCRSEEYEELALDPGEVVIIEGLHALNPLLFRHIKPETVYRIYLYAETLSYDAKLLRRTVRDYYFRSSDAALTLSMWKDVTDGEKKYIRPFIDTANVLINTFFDYETRLLAPEGIKLLSDVPSDCPEKDRAERLLESISGLEPIPYDLVPDDSLMLEFIKKK